MSAIAAGVLGSLGDYASYRDTSAGDDNNLARELGLLDADRELTDKGRAFLNLALDVVNAAAKCDDPADIQRGLLMFRQECGEEFEFRDNGGNWTGKKRCLFNHDLSRYRPAPAEPEAKVKGAVATDAPAKCKHCGRYYGDHQVARSLCPNGDYEVNGWLETAFEPATLDDAQAASGTGVEDFVQDLYAHLRKAQKDGLWLVWKSHKGVVGTRDPKQPIEHFAYPPSHYIIVPRGVDPEVVAAHERGEKVEGRYVNKDSGYKGPWVTIEAPNFHAPDTEWRVAPKPRAWTLDTVPPLPVQVRWKETGNRTYISAVTESGVCIASRINLGFEAALNDLEDITDPKSPKPCGVEEVGS